MPASRILVVEDSDSLRSLICAALESHSEFRVVAQSREGFAAIQKAEQLQPDVVVLDIGLPNMNGFAVARHIRMRAPRARVLFLSLGSSAEDVRHAFGAGGHGYLTKLDAGHELLPAVSAVLQGGQFISRTVRGLSTSDIAAPSTTGSARTEGFHTQPPETERRLHLVEFHSSATRMLESFADFLSASLDANKRAIAITAESHRHRLSKMLQTRGVDVAAAIAEERYFTLDVADALSTFMVGDRLDRRRFSQSAGALLERAAHGADPTGVRVVACGECAPVLWARGLRDVAIELEQLWDQIADTHRVDVLCSYPMKDARGTTDQEMVRRISDVHSDVWSN